jgi:hypothetical protein
MTTELSPKRLELLHEAVPKASRVMFLHDPQAAPNAWKLTQEAAPHLGITLAAGSGGGRRPGWRSTERIAAARGNAVRVGHQQLDCEDARTHNSTVAAGASRRGDRVAAAICYTLVRFWHIAAKTCAALCLELAKADVHLTGIRPGEPQ